MVVVVLFMIGAVVLLAAVALVIQVVVRRRQLTQPADRRDGLGDDIRLGVGLNNFGP